MNVLFLTLSNMENVNERGIYSDLVRELARIGINMYVVSPREKRTNLPTELSQIENINILKVKTGNITKVNFIEKGLSTLSIEKQYLKAVKRYFSDVRFDMVMYSTPPITFEKVVKYFKQKHQSKTYLVLKDIFPQNAVDINIIKEGSLIWKHFRKKEKRLYKNSDMIGCMSKGNVDYVLKHNPFIDKKKVEIFPNSIEPLERVSRTKKNKELFEKYNIPQNSTLFVYGGNLGKPQGIEFLLEVADNFHQVDNGYLLIVGAGTEYEKIRHHIDSIQTTNVRLYNKMPKNEYDQLLEIADVGLIFLDKRFTIPNFPSRLTAYMEYSIPVLAATDKNTDLKDVLKESGSGLWSESGDLNSFISNAITLSLDKRLRNQMGELGRLYLEENYDIKKTVEIIIKHL
ncbi:glycosyltransferase family 4 protein [Peribacillus frigoritolerans]|uniref:glycosyltransferase family 4 protein n=1 Tax=Peribacillus frigoritolerans TaxID=450367 RepID=UPI003D08A2F3